MVSKRLSVVLRHDKGEFELRFDERALVPLEDVLRLPIMHKKRIDRKQIMSAIYHNDKKRFRAVIKDGKTFIGASQGHSFRINPDSAHTRTPTENVPALVHSTHYDFLQSILQHGIRPGGLREDHRQMVHCLEDKPSAARFYPPGVDVVLHISPQKTDATWYRSENDYYMTSETVPAKAIYKVSVVAVMWAGFAPVPLSQLKLRHLLAYVSHACGRGTGAKPVLSYERMARCGVCRGGPAT